MFRLNIKKKFFSVRVSRNRLPRQVMDGAVLGGVQDEVLCGFEQPYLVENVPAHDKGLELDGL